MTRFETVIEFLSKARRDLADDLRGVERGIHALVDAHDDAKLIEIGLDRRLHFRILELQGERAPVQALRLMHLTEGGSGRGLLAETLEPRPPVRAKLGGHAAPYEGPAHGGGLVLKLRKFGGIFRRDRVGDGRDELRHLH